MRKYWRKPAFRLVFFVILIILVPSVVYFFKGPILSRLPSNLTGKPNVIKPGTCLILEEKYCSQAKVIDWTNPASQKLKLIGFRLPAGVPVFMPINGQVAKAKLGTDGVFKGLWAQVFDPNKPIDSSALWYIFTGDLKFPDMLSLNKKAGDSFGTIGNTDIENAGGYNLLFYTFRGIGRNTVVDEDEMRKLFPLTKQ